MIVPYSVELGDARDKLVQVTWSAQMSAAKLQVTLRSVSTKILVDKASNRIDNITHSITTQTFTPIGQGLIRSDSQQERKDYRTGHTKVWQRNNFQRSIDFGEVEELQGINLKADFKHFQTMRSKK